MSKQKNKIQESFDKITIPRQPLIPAHRVESDSEGKKRKRGDFRKLKHRSKKFDD